MQLTIGLLIAALGGILFTVLTGGGPKTEAPLNQAAERTAAARAEALQLAFER